MFSFLNSILRINLNKFKQKKTYHSNILRKKDYKNYVQYELIHYLLYVCLLIKKYLFLKYLN